MAETITQPAPGGGPLETSPGPLVPGLVREAALRDPGALALAGGGRRMTYGELEERANGLAHRLRALGVGPESRVAIFAGRSLELVLGALAVFKAGGAYVPLDPLYPRDRLAFMLEDSRARVVLTVEGLAGELPEGLPALTLDAMELPRETAPPAVEVSPLNLAYVIYTSGSTGRPKGVMVQHASLAGFVRRIGTDFELGPGDRTTFVASPAFDASILEIWPPLASGASLHIPGESTRTSAAGMIRWLSERRITFGYLPTPLAEAAAGEPWPADAALRGLFTGGDRLRRWPPASMPAPLYNTYGPTEATVFVTFATLAPGAGREGLPPIGPPLAGVPVYLLDQDSRPVPVGEEGEIWIGGGVLARGYLDRPALTAEAFRPDPFAREAGSRMYRTGDLARRLPGGDLDFVERLDHQVKLRGFRIELGEIEANLAACPGVREAVVLVKEEEAGKRLVAFAAPVGPVSDPGELRAFLKRRLPEYMVPSAFVWLDVLPLTPNGKVDRRTLAKLDVSPAAAATDYVAPRTAVEETLAGLWAGLLGLDRVGVRSDFLELGGHSLVALQVLSRVRGLFGVELGIQALFEAPTVEGLARRIEEAREDGLETGPALAPVAREVALPLSPAQARLWFLDRLRPGSPVYNVPVAWRLLGPVAPAALAAALGEIVRRHETLRTRFEEGEEGPAQAIDPAPAPVLPQVDLEGLPEPLRRSEETRLAAAAAVRPFDLARGPLFRALLLRLDAAERVLVLNLHHIVSDGWSVGVMAREIEALYQAALAGVPSPLPGLPVQYADYAVWQREQLRGGALDGQLAWWRARLAGQPPLLALPADRRRTAVRTFRGGAAPLRLGTELSSRLRALSRRRGSPLFMTLLAGFLALLHRYTAQSDLVVGTALAGRGREELEKLIGFFVNLVALRVETTGELSFQELLGRARETALGAYAHGDLPFDRLVEELAPERSLAHAPLVQAVLVLHNEPMAPPRLPGARAEEVPLSIGSARFDLVVALTETAGGLAGEVEYSLDLFEPATARRLARHLETLLEAAAAAPEARVSELPLLSAPEREELLREGEGARLEAPWVPVHELFSARARRRPEALAVAAGERRLTYGEIEAKSNRLAHHLRSLGVGPGTLVGVCAERTPERVVGIVAALKAGGAYVSLDPSYPPERLAWLLEDSRAPVLLTESRFLDRMPATGVIALDRDLDGLAGDESRPPAVPLDPESLAYVIYTSGSTGRPKGVAIPHRGLLNLVHWHLAAYGLTAEDRGTQVASPAFDASVWEMWPLLAAGASAHVPGEETRLSAARMLAWWAERGITHAFLPTPLAEAVLEEELPEDLRLRVLVTGGDRLHRGPRPGTPFRLMNHYGPTEYSVVTTAGEAPPVLPEDDRLPPIGRAIANTRVLVLDPYGHPAPPGVSGELHVAGEGLARGYLGRPDLTAERFVPDPLRPGERMYRTGDLVRWLPDGSLDFLGRIDHQVKIRGIRVEPGEIEAALARCPGVREAVVTAREDHPGDRRLAAYVAGGGVTADGLRTFLERELPASMVPQDWVLLDALPLTPNGKVDRRALPAPERRVETAVAPRTPMEELLAGVFRQLFNLPAVGVHDGFFALGGHSLLAAQVVSRVRRLTGVELPISAVFEEPTLEGLARRVEAELSGKTEATAPPLWPVSRGEGARLPLSFAQARLWFLDRMQPGSAAYNIPVAWRLRGELAPAALAGALGEVARRHEALRTRFAEGPDGPVQVISPAAPPGPLVLPLVDLGGLPEAARRGEEARRTAEEALRPFDLFRGPLLRPLLLRLDAREWVLVLAMHHIVSDGWSMGVLARELEALYKAALAGARSPLPELPLQYADYAIWQREQLRGEALEKQLGYWRERLAGHPPALELPADRPRPVAQSFRGGLEPLRLGTDVADRLGLLGRRNGTSPFMTLLAGFLALLQRCTGQGDLVVGTPTAGRGRVELEGMIGFFVNTLALRTDASGDPAFLELIGRTRKTALEAYAHAELPFERLVEELSPERDLSRSPIFQVMFVLQTAAAAPPALAGLEVEERVLAVDSAKFDLTLILKERGGEIDGELEYSRDLFEASTVRRMARHLEILLEGAAARPESRLSDLPLLSAAERAELLEWNDTAREYPLTPWVHESFAAHARRHPEALAVAMGERRLSYGELEEQSNRLAHHLRSLGVGPDVVVGICAERTPERVVGIVAILKAGGAYASFDPAYPAERLALAMEDARTPVLLTESRLLGRVPDSAALVVCLDRDLDGLTGDGSRPPAVEVDGDNLAYVIFTSGSTGRPKGVAIPHKGLLNLVRWHHETYGLTPEDVGTQVASPAFDVAIWELWPLLAGGAGLAIPEEETRLSSSRMVRWWREAGITLAFLPTPLADGILGEELPADLPVRWLVVGGDRLHRAPRRGTPFRLSNIYGPAEHSVVTTMSVVPPEGRVTIGRALANTRVHVLDAEGVPVPVGVAGELYVSGEGLARGYVWRPELTAERFLPDPFGALMGTIGGRMYRTGDRVRRLPDGDLDFLGRLDHQVKIRGIRVELGEIESVLGGHPGVREAVALALDGRLVAFVAGTDLSAGDLRAFLERRLPLYMVPQGWSLLEALPLTPNGKVDRRALERIGAAETLEAEEPVAPRTAVESLLAEVWAELLKMERVGVRDDFFRLGGHSLLATRLLARVRHLFEVDLDLRTLFNAPTIEALAAAIERDLLGEPAPEEDAAPVPPEERPPHAGNPPLSFAQARLWFLDRLRPGTAFYNMPMAWRLRGELAPAALAGALGEIARRHEALRTRFAEEPDGPVQVIDPPGPLVLPLVDLGGLPEAARRGEEARRTAEEALRPFDLSRGPLLRPLLLRLDVREWVLVLAMHHIVSDGWSMGVLTRELEALYKVALAGDRSPLPELPLQYADYAIRQREQLRGEALEKQLGYWRERLAGHPPALELPVDRPRPAAQSFRGGLEPLRLGPETAERLRLSSRRDGMPLFMTLLAGFLALLHRYTGQDDLVVGTPTAGRGRMELEGLIGFFVNTLALRADASGDPSFSELARRARETALEAYAHADLPFERLVEELAPERELGRSPVFQVMLVLQGGPAEPPRLAGLETEALKLTIDSAKFDLTLLLTEMPGEIAGDLEYDADLFEASTVRRMVRHLEILLEGAAAHPESRLSDLPLLSAAERAELLEWNDTAREYPLTPWVHESFAAHARRRPEALAVVMGERRLSYGELEEQSNRLAHHLRSLGVGPDVVVGVCAERTPERVVGIVAILKAGGAYASFDPVYPAERLALAMEDARTPVLLTESRLLGRVPDSAALVVCLDRDLDGLTGDGSKPPAVELDGDNLAYVIFTSGSTGRPKGVAIPHKGLLNLVRWHHETYDLTPEDVGTQVASPAFDVAIWELWPLLAGGAGLAIPDEETRLSSSRMVRWWREAGITLAFLPTPLADGILGEELPADLPVRWLVVGGDRLHRAPRRGTPFRLSNIYGPAEHSVVTTMSVVPPEGRVTIGRALANTRVHVLDAEGVPVPVGVAGELYVSGEGLARGYVWRPELTAERFLPDPFGTLMGTIGGRMYRTGDRVRRLPDGDLDFLGRLDHQVKIRGIRVELGEIESVLGGHPGVREAVALALDGRLVAFVAGTDLSADGLRAFLERRLPPYMVPQGWSLLEALPLTPNGKVDRRALERIGAASASRLEEPAAPRTEVERRLAEVWAELLGVERVGVRDDFFRLGGHSLLATRVLARVRRLFAVELDLRVLFNAPTVEALAAEIERKLRERAAPWAAPELVPVPRGRQGEDLPLSFAQARLWFLDRLQPGTSVYNMPVAWRLRGRLDPGLLAAALAEIARRHEALRTRFAEGQDGPVQVISPPPPSGALVLPLVDLGGLPEPARRREEELWTAGEALRPFDLARGPLLRPLLLRLEEREWVLLLAMHHIVSDGWSMGVLLRELDALYRALLAGKPSPLPELPVQYADYAVWQREQLRGEALESRLGYWRERLAGHPPALELPADRPRPNRQTSRGAVEPLRLEAELAGRLRALSLNSGAPLFMTLLSGFLALLHRYTGQADLMVGTPEAGRGREELEGLIGFFVNTLVLRNDASEDPSFVELLGRVRQTTLGDYAHADLPFERLVEEVSRDRDLSRSPLFQVMFALQSVSGPVAVAGLEAEELRLALASAKFDLTLGMTESGAEIPGELEYNADLFEAATVRRMARHLESLLAGAAAHPEARLSELPLLSPAERRELLAWNGPPLEVPWMPVHELFREQARLRPGAVAVALEDRRLTYGEIEARSNRLAHHLRSLGVGPEVLVGVCAERTPERVVGIVAVLKAGGAYVPLDPSYPRERLTWLLEDAAAPVLLTERRFLDRVPPSAAVVIALDRDLDGMAGDEAAPPPPLDLGPESLAYVVYTSGSTGRPKGVAIPHGGLLSLVRWHCETYGVTPEDRGTQVASPAFDASVWELWPLLAAGAGMYVPDPEVRLSAPRTLRWWAERGITLAFLPTPLAEAVLEEEIPAGLDLRVRALVTGGDRLHRVPRPGTPFRLVNHYGPSEYSVVTTAGEIPPAAPETAGVPSIGRPIANARVYVLDAHRQPVPVGVPGELHAGGPGLARGYLRRPGLTAEKFVPDPAAPGERMYRTGDLVRWRPDGGLEFLGRLDHQVKIRGMRVELGEIEAALDRLPGVHEAVVMVREDRPGDRRLAAYVVGAGEARPSADALREALERELPSYMVPQDWVLLDELPLTPNDKIDRRALPAPERRAETAVEPRTPVERALADIFREVFNLRAVGIHDDFFALGGHSLLATRLVSRVRRSLGIDLEIRVLFEEPTIEGLARRIEAQGHRAPEPAETASAVPVGGASGTSDHESSFVAPRTPLEELMTEIWAEALSLDRVGIHDNFWDLGGHSRLVAGLLARVNESFGVELPPQALVKAPTIAGFTAAIGEILLEEEQDGLARIERRTCE